MKTFTQFLHEMCEYGEGRISQNQLDALEQVLDNLFASLDIDIEFTRHFFDRVNDARNQRQITLCELMDIFKDLYKKYGVQISHTDREIEELIKSISTKINIPIVLKWDAKSKEIDMVAKTVMRKDNFQSRNKVLRVA